MTEVQIDRSRLPRVQEVRQDFAVLEDGALAHRLSKCCHGSVLTVETTPLHERFRRTLHPAHLTECNDNYGAAQVVQDEKIARYMQNQELKAQWRAHETTLGTENSDEGSNLSEPRRSKDKKKLSYTTVAEGKEYHYHKTAQSHTLLVDGLFDYIDDTIRPVFISPTKRQPEKLGCQKSRDKKEGCKQQ
ncbi:uncharacterized protein RBU57_016045 [Macrochelys suwanniensis]